MSGCQSCDGYCFQPDVCGEQREPEWAPELREVLGEALRAATASPAIAHLHRLADLNPIPKGET